MNDVAKTISDDVFLEAYLEPFRQWLDQDDVSEILVNQPGEIWVERAGARKMECLSLPAVDAVLMQRLATQVARQSNQGINRERPLLAATLPDGTRIQVVAPPATRAHWVMAIRRHRLAEVSLDAYRVSLPEPPVIDSALAVTDSIAYLRAAVAARQTILVSGGTSSGKTSFLNALLREIPTYERIILVEDTPEIRLAHKNSVGLVAVKGEMGEAKISTDDLLQAALRLRPDRIVLGELRGNEAVSFLRAINTGHPGSFSTIHANTPEGAIEQLALMVMQSGIGLSRQDVIAYASSVIDIVVQLRLHDGNRGIASIMNTSRMFQNSNHGYMR